MATEVLDFEGGTQGATITTTSSTPALSFISGATYQTAAAFHGTYGCRFTSAGAAVSGRYTLATSGPTFSVGFWIRTPSASFGAGDATIAQLRDSAGPFLKLLYKGSNNKIAIQDIAGTPVQTVAATVALNTAYYVSIFGTINAAGGAASTVTCKVYDNTSTLITSTGTVTTATLGSTPFTAIDFGQITALTSGLTSDIDYIRVAGTTANEFVPPSKDGLPTANAGANQYVEALSTVTLDGSGSTDPDATGSVASYAWTQTAGTTVTLSSATAQKPTYTAPATVNGETEAFSLIVTDDQAQQCAAASTVSVVVAAHTYWRLEGTGQLSVVIEP